MISCPQDDARDPRLGRSPACSSLRMSRSRSYADVGSCPTGEWNGAMKIPNRRRGTLTPPHEDRASARRTPQESQNRPPRAAVHLACAATYRHPPRCVRRVCPAPLAWTIRSYAHVRHLLPDTCAYSAIARECPARPRRTEYSGREKHRVVLSFRRIRSAYQGAADQSVGRISDGRTACTANTSVIGPFFDNAGHDGNANARASTTQSRARSARRNRSQTKLGQFETA